MGLIMPRHAGLTEDVTRRIEDFVVILLLPLFFVVTGLRTDIGLLDRPELWLITLALLAVALLGKLFGAALAARIAGFDGRSSAVIGVLMNTRGLTELIVLNLALEKGVISDGLFAMLVIMALVTTLVTGPMMKALDPRNELGAPLEEELEEARAMSMADFPVLREQSVLVAPEGDAALGQLLSLAGPLARSEPPRELIIARLVRPPRSAGFRGGLQTEDRLLAEASSEVNAARRELIDVGVAARAVAFISTDLGADLARLASSDEVALVLVNGRRPLLGEGVPRGAVGHVLREAPCDVAVLVAKGDEAVLPGAGRPGCGALRRRRARLGRARAGRVDLRGDGRAPEAPGRRRADRRPRPREPAARRRRAAGPAVRRRVRRAGGRPARPRGDRRGGGPRRPARYRPVRALGARGPRSGTLGDRQGRPRARSVRSPRRARGRARAARGRDSLHLVGARPHGAGAPRAARVIR